MASLQEPMASNCHCCTPRRPSGSVSPALASTRSIQSSEWPTDCPPRGWSLLPAPSADSQTSHCAVSRRPNLNMHPQPEVRENIMMQIGIDSFAAAYSDESLATAPSQRLRELV